MMKRLQFVASLFGVGGLATPTKPEPAIKGIAVSRLQSGQLLKLKKPRNNECPYCGTVAPEYHRPFGVKPYDVTGHRFGIGPDFKCEAILCKDRETGRRFEIGVDENLALHPFPYEGRVGPTRRMVDGGCKNCGAAFWQNAVEETESAEAAQ